MLIIRACRIIKNVYISTFKCVTNIVTDAPVKEQENKAAMTQMKQALQSMREQSVANGNSKMTLDEINDEIAAYRKP